MTDRPFKVIKASAGSGKTYALVRQFLVLALQSDYTANYRHILAITFTNAAAAEMKERVMQKLHEFAGRTPSPLATEIAEQLGISAEKLGLRAANAYKDMLHHYSYLSILTIDSFTHKIIRSFARDLRLHHDFNIEVDATRFLEKLVDACLQKVGESEEITRYLEEFLTDNIEEGKRMRLHDELVEASKIILREDSLNSLEKLGQLSLEDYAKVRKTLISENKSFSDNAKTISKNALEYLKKVDLEISDFSNGGKGNITVFKKVLSDDIDIPGSKFYDWPDAKNKANGKASTEVKKRIEEHAETIVGYFHEFSSVVNASSVQKFKMNQVILKNLHTTGLMENLNEIGSQLREEENILLISDFHKKVNEIVRDNQAPFIFERIGVRYKHILIDEFQDTSLLQWSNTLPLLEESLSQKQTNLIVGDAKQSIYRWRGGNVEQFIDLPEVPLEAGRPDAQRLFRENIEVLQLRENRRSRTNIVEFNNKVFSKLSGILGKYQNVYADAAQVATRSSGGYVKFEIIEEKDKIERTSLTYNSIVEKINNCLSAGFQPGDIAILVRRGELEGALIAEMLVSKGYRVVTRDSFLIQNSPVVRLAMGYLGYKSDPSKHFYGVEMVQAYSQILGNDMLDIFSGQYMVIEKKLTEIRLNDFFREETGVDLNSITGNPYNQAIALLRSFKLTLDTATEYLLEKIRYYCIQKQWSIHDFIVWWEDSRAKLYTASAADNGSIQIMTVHKAKGLQFPVVIYPRYANSYNNKHLWVNTEMNETGLPCAYVKYSKSAESILGLPEFVAETEKDLLDETNVAYVAMTRAEERLYVVQQFGDKNDSYTKQFIACIEEEFPELRTDKQLHLGEELPYESKIPASNTESIDLSKEESVLPDFRVIPARVKKDKLRELGELVHECFATLENANSIAKVVESVCERNGIHAKSKRQLIENEINSTFRNDQFSSWFTPDLKTYNEREIITSEGRVLRPDRVIVREDEVVVIDYKTGEVSDSHRSQVKKYLHALGSMYTQPVRGYLFYTKNQESIEVLP